jgi:SAM-dependent methyltransferase
MTLKRALRSLQNYFIHDQRKSLKLPNFAEDPLILCNFCATAFNNTGPIHSEFLSCPVCGAIARERVVYQCILDELQRRTGNVTMFFREAQTLQTLRLLEFSPRYNPIRRQIYLDTLGEYLSSDFDLSAHRADVKLDLTNSTDIVPYRDHFDIIICSHVVEHIQNYKVALHNLFSLLSPGGFLIFQVPLLERRYVQVTGDEFHGDNTRVFHHFGFDLQIELNEVFSSAKPVVGLLDFTITSPEIDPEKYSWLKEHPRDCIVLGESKVIHFGLGIPDLCDAFIAYRDS